MGFAMVHNFGASLPPFAFTLRTVGVLRQERQPLAFPSVAVSSRR